MKHLIAAATSALLLSAGAASATEVSASVGLELQKNSKAYGVEEVNNLRLDLVDQIQRALDAAGPNAPKQVVLVLEAATPNHPTAKQFDGSRLSLSSTGIGGAVITGKVTGADGVSQPISYRWYETDINAFSAGGTWSDAEHAFSNLAAALAKGKTPNAGPYRPQMLSPAAFTGLSRTQ